MSHKRGSTPMVGRQVAGWVRGRTMRQQVSMGTIAALALLVLLKTFMKGETHLFVASQTSQAVGILLLLYKLTITKTCSGLSMKTQELTVIFLIIKIMCYFTLLPKIHVLLDSISLASTLWVIYMMRYKLQNTYMQELDTMPLYYVLVPCAVVALIGHPGWQSDIVTRFLYMYFTTIEAVSVLPQLLLIQNAKLVEPFTAHYVFALGVARFFSCANWIFLLINTKGGLLTQIGQGHLYLLVILLSEVVQTFILADFCYYYVKSVMEGQRTMRLPSMV
ncbi:putative ER lumen protein-retaining receptor C28H8.4 [Chenopodium quinoa]|uniref:putative ER lumen protein-retaining receptor C28H8.4 n=1 Tax=Chenopodium quinoa TaxID=63459 RepID=UPI000B793DE8|nr:putative ER lumen protein-retaining receptor C28H8.4 [Chenopodium quinoa]